MILLTETIFVAHGQSVESLVEAKPFSYSGGLSLTNMYTNTNDPNNLRDPFFWQIQANINFNFFGVINAPFSASFNNQESTLTQPALPNQFGISPAYKIYTAHLGWRSMNFSQYSLGGMTFLGVGAEVNPESYWLSGKAMYGRLQQNIQPIRGQNPGVYRRNGYGAQLKAGKGDFITLTIFRARDDERSLVLDSLAGDVAPQENLVWSVATKKKITERLGITAEIARSGFTQDTRNQDRIQDNNNYFNNVGKLFTPNATTQYKSAMVFAADYKLENMGIQLGYSRIDPDYESMGVQGVNNDLEEYKATLNWQLFQGRIAVSTSGGLQRNNLDESMSKGVRKLVGSSQLTWAVTEKWNMNLGYSNFSTQSIGRRTPALQPIDIQLDTLEFFQVTENASFNTGYQFGSGKVKHGINVSANYQQANDSENNDNNAFNSNLLYNLSFPEIKLSTVAAYNFNRTSTNSMVFTAMGPTLSVIKPIVKEKINLSVSYTLLSSQMEAVENRIGNLVFSAKYTLKKKHNFTLSAINSARNTIGETEAQSLSEQRVNFQYSLSF